jgi:hypothetical protein
LSLKAVRGAGFHKQGYRVWRGNVDSPRTAGECRFTANRGGMSIYREPRRNVDLSRTAEECQFTADRGGMSIYRGPRGNVDLSRMAGECRFTANRGGMSIHRGWRGNVDLPRIPEECTAIDIGIASCRRHPLLERAGPGGTFERKSGLFGPRSCRMVLKL